MRRGRKGSTRALGDVVPAVLGELGYGKANMLVRLADCWESVVGPEAALHCRPTALRGDLLEATADSSTWCQQLQLRREEILAGLQRELAGDAPTDLWLRVG